MSELIYFNVVDIFEPNQQSSPASFYIVKPATSTTTTQDSSKRKTKFKQADFSELLFTINPEHSYFLKQVAIVPGGNSLTNSNALNDIYTEIAFLKHACKDNVDKIVRMFCEIEIPHGRGIILERAHCNMNEMYFDPDLMFKSKDLGDYSHIDFLKYVERFFTEILNYLESKSYVYCDWKFENILCFNHRADQEPVLKLSDFGSLQAVGAVRTNPRNINQLFSSPNLSSNLPQICPYYQDDYFGVKCLFFKLNGLVLPWERLFSGIENPSENEMTEIIVILSFLKNHNLVKLNTKNVVYWPEKDLFN